MAWRGKGSRRRSKEGLLLLPGLQLQRLLLLPVPLMLCCQGGLLLQLLLLLLQLLLLQLLLLQLLLLQLLLLLLLL